MRTFRLQWSKGADDYVSQDEHDVVAFWSNDNDTQKALDLKPGESFVRSDGVTVTRET